MSEETTGKKPDNMRYALPSRELPECDLDADAGPREFIDYYSVGEIPELVERRFVNFFVDVMEIYASARVKAERERVGQERGALLEALDNGRDYLMSSPTISVEDALEAFGFGRNGLSHPLNETP